MKMNRRILAASAVLSVLAVAGIAQSQTARPIWTQEDLNNYPVDTLQPFDSSAIPLVVQPAPPGILNNTPTGIPDVAPNRLAEPALDPSVSVMNDGLDADEPYVGPTLAPIAYDGCFANDVGDVICPSTTTSTSTLPATTLATTSTSTSTSTSTPTLATSTTTTTTTTSSTTTSSSTTSTVPSSTGFGVLAGSTAADSFLIAGSGHSVTGAVKSNGGIVVTGAASRVSGVTEYATTLSVSGVGNTFTPTPVKKAAGLPISVSLVPYLPGGSVASTAVAYTAVAASSCVAGTWTVSATQLPLGVVYVPCAVNVTGTGVSRATSIVANGAITVSGAGLKLSAVSAYPSLLSTGPIMISGASPQFAGQVRSESTFTPSGAGASFGCIAADKVAIKGAGAIVTGNCKVTA
jgi:cytoskeletal protein CcmA (bactofilin family)